MASKKIKIKTEKPANKFNVSNELAAVVD